MFSLRYRLNNYTLRRMTSGLNGLIAKNLNGIIHEICIKNVTCQ
jgi:hypothetical protein